MVQRNPSPPHTKGENLAKSPQPDLRLFFRYCPAKLLIPLDTFRFVFAFFLGSQNPNPSINYNPFQSNQQLAISKSVQFGTLFFPLDTQGGLGEPGASPVLVSLFFLLSWG